MQFTKKQLEIMKFIAAYQEDCGVSPTLDEMAAHMGVSKITVHEHIGALVKKGALRKVKHCARSLEIIAAGFRKVGLPLLGRIAAGRPIEAIENSETFELEALVPTGSDCYALRVQGDSMMDEGIRDGDYVIVENRRTALNGETVVAIIGDNEATLKKFYREENRIRLQPANEALEPIYVDGCEIRGVVRGVVRRY